MGIEKITSAIVDEAAAECEQILNVANVKCEAIIRELEERIDIETEVALDQARDEKERIVSRRKSVAEIDSRKRILAKKQEIINKCFDNAVEYILGLEEAKYVDFLVALGKNTEFKEGVLIFNEKEKTTVGPKIAAALEDAVGGGKFAVAEETRKLKGGYVLQCGQVFIINSVEAVLQEKKKELTMEVAGILFPPEK